MKNDAFENQKAAHSTMDKLRKKKSKKIKDRKPVGLRKKPC